MRIGLTIPTFGPLADAESIVTVSVVAEGLGYDALWTGDRSLHPLAPRDRYPGLDGELPLEYANHMDPLTALTFAAAHTNRLRLGTSAMNALWQSPVLLARSLTTLDILSGGRVDAGFGLGWSRDEYAAANVPWRGRGARLDETIEVLHKLWSRDVAGHDGPLFTLPETRVGLKPVQRPHPPILLAAFTPAGFRRIAQLADGWLPVDMPLQYVLAQWDSIKRETEAVGRDSSALRMPLRIDLNLIDTVGDADQMPLAGTLGQYVDYARAAEDGGITEIFIDLGFCATTLDQRLELAARFIEGVRGTAGRQARPELALHS